MMMMMLALRQKPHPAAGFALLYYQFCCLVNGGTMGVNSLPKTVTRRRRGCDLNPGPSAPESSTLTTRRPSHPIMIVYSSSQGCHTATGTHTPHGITQCYLPPGRGNDIPALTPAKAGTKRPRRDARLS